MAQWTSNASTTLNSTTFVPIKAALICWKWRGVDSRVAIMVMPTVQRFVWGSLNG